MGHEKLETQNIQEEVIGGREKEKVDKAGGEGWELGGDYPQQNTSGDRVPWGMFNKTLRTGMFTWQLHFAGR